MLKYVGLCLGLFMLGMGVANAATCAPGEWLSDDTCVLCTAGYACPGNDKRTDCYYKKIGGMPSYSDTDGATACTACPKTTLDTEHISHYWYWSSDTPAGSAYKKSACRVSWLIETDVGMKQFSCAYGINGYDSVRAQHCMASNVAGTARSTCIAGYYMPTCETDGPQCRYWDESYEKMIEYQHCIPVGKGYYSAADAVTRTSIMCKVSNPYVKFDNGLEILTYAARTTTPSLTVRIGGRACYINTAPGYVDDGINIQYDGSDFHATD